MKPVHYTDAGGPGVYDVALQLRLRVRLDDHVKGHPKEWDWKTLLDLGADDLVEVTPVFLAKVSEERSA